MSFITCLGLRMGTFGKMITSRHVTTHMHAHPHTRAHTHTHTGIAGSSFAAGACVSADIRDKDDHFNAAVGGALAGSVFGFKSEFSCTIN